ncbi:hypothetical protein CPT03_06800 [Pedobacter ginsengisoli]|uniref:Activator of Hsp90 ATPase homologue 1/2-like C-terminal domain-containing protein n=1 Tax=Pedobacter ginsengisoli TaxID=363852 RepID=A0A2D1U3M9_9SPHI|nr:SRPBCC domain-containing protein [Pedobacter ginsengisoli]ATP56195.1 hypothetical protein CPT03_06800 [Pedobacter ginsengisoli]
MKNFDWTSFTIRILVKTSLSDIYNAWTTGSEIEKWFLKDASFTNTNGAKIGKDEPIRKDYSYEWLWYLYEDKATGKITEANGSDFIQFTFEGECLVDVKLSVQKDYVLVELTQKNIPTDENSMRNIRLGCHNGWSFYLVNLKSIYEGGIDLRGKDTDFKPMLNT